MQEQVQNYATLTKRVELQHEKKLASNLKSMQSKALSKYYEMHKHNFVGNKIVPENSSGTITDTSSVLCFDQLFNICFARFETSHII